MLIDYNHLTPVEAVAIQKELRQQLNLSPLQKEITTIGGGDISFNKYSSTVYAGIVVMQFPSLQIIESKAVVDTTEFPYIPGLLAFREVPALSKAWEALEKKPDVLVLDGHGIAHPRRMGIATHFGLVIGTPTIGCAKSVLTGKYTEPPVEAGAYTDLIHQNEVIAKVLRTKKNTKPVFVSPGNLITMEQSLEIILQCVRKYRIPEPTRFAHNFVNEERRKYLGEEGKTNAG
jgi:deoxyribonuclease V